MPKATASLIDGFLKKIEATWPGSTKTIQAIREHNEYLEDQGYTDIILENLDENLKKEEEENVGDGIVWDSAEDDCVTDSDSRE
jgi:hypothetical protein